MSLFCSHDELPLFNVFAFDISFAHLLSPLWFGRICLGRRRGQKGRGREPFSNAKKRRRKNRILRNRHLGPPSDLKKKRWTKEKKEKKNLGEISQATAPVIDHRPGNGGSSSFGAPRVAFDLWPLPAVSFFSSLSRTLSNPQAWNMVRSYVVQRSSFGPLLTSFCSALPSKTAPFPPSRARYYLLATAN